MKPKKDERMVLLSQSHEKLPEENQAGFIFLKKRHLKNYFQMPCKN